VAAGHGEGDAHTVKRGRIVTSRGRRAAPGGQRVTRRRSPIGLFISTKTADHHIQHIYKKIDVSTRATAALWAIQNAIVG